MVQRRLVYVVAKAPRAGAVKTRLCPPLRPEQAALLYRGFLLDSLETAARIRGAAVRVICPSGSEQKVLARLLPSSVGLTQQRSPGLGSALEECFSTGLADGYQAVAVLASDNPTLPERCIEQAFEQIERRQADVALGPTEDGGYYLLAARAVHPRLFRDMTWSTAEVLAETLRRCRADYLRTALVDTWYDVDTPAALAALARRLPDLPPTCAPHTRSALAAIRQETLACV
jgi:rSAM/selenodomain-associated transferase 1